MLIIEVMAVVVTVSAFILALVSDINNTSLSAR
jgi:hypothetical protein